MKERTLLIVILKEEIKINELLRQNYLNTKGITIIGKYFSYDKNIDKKNYTDQIKLMVDTHKILSGCRLESLNQLGSTIGKDIEGFKVQLKKLERDYYSILDKSIKNQVDKMILSDGKRMIEQGKQSIKYIYKHDYLGIIERSMNREEICIGRADEGNLRKKESTIEIGIVKGMTYDLVEEDLYRYIKRLQRKNIKIDEEELIKLFVHSSHLSFNSIDYLRALCTYPRDSFKIWERYRQNKKDKSIEEYFVNLKKCMNYENKIFVK